MLSEGQYQSLVWARTAAESVLTTQFLKALREPKIEVDAVASNILKRIGAAIPDKRKQAQQFMAPVVKKLVQVLKKHAPAKVNQDANDELVRAKTKLAMAGLALTPRKGSPEDDHATGPQHEEASSSNPRDDKAGPAALPLRKRKSAVLEQKPEAKQPMELSVKQLLTGKAHQSLAENRPSAISSEHVDKWMQSFESQMKEKWREFNKRVNLVVKLLTENNDKSSMVEGATKFGLVPRFATRLTINNLSKCIAVAKYQTA